MAFLPTVLPMPPSEIDVLDHLGGFISLTPTGTRYRNFKKTRKLLKRGTIGKLVRYNKQHEFDNTSATMAVYKVPGYAYEVVVYFRNDNMRRFHEPMTSYEQAFEQFRGQLNLAGIDLQVMEL